MQDYERLKILVQNAIGMYVELHAESYSKREEFWELLLGELGTDDRELEHLGIDLNEIKPEPIG